MIVKSRFISVFFLILFSCSLVAAAEDGDLTILVTKNDTVTGICVKYLESPGSWREVAKFNRLPNPDLIFPGQKLIIPAALLKGSPADAKVSFVRGDAWSRSKGSGVWQRLHLNDVVAGGDSVKTGDSGALELAFEDSAVLLLRAYTELEVKTSTKKRNGNIIRDFFLSAGRTVSRLKTATGAAPRYRIYTPSSVAASRGTEFGVSVDPSDTTRTEVLRGLIGVAAKSRTVEVSAGQGTLVKKGKHPLKSRKLLLPPSPQQVETVYKTLPLVLSFGQEPGASSYRVMLAGDAEIRGLVIDRLLKPDQPLEIADAPDGLYYLQTRSVDADGLEGVPSVPINIRIRTKPLPPPLAFSGIVADPEDMCMKIRWPKAAEAVGYRLQIALDRSFKSIVDEQNRLTATEYKTGPLAVGTYYIRTASLAEDGYEGAWSKTVGLTLTLLPSSPVMEEPQIREKEITFKWSSSGEETVFHFQMAGDSSFKNIIVDSKTDRTGIAVGKPDTPGVYFARTSGIDKAGREGNFSQVRSLEIR